MEVRADIDEVTEWCGECTGVMGCGAIRGEVLSDTRGECE
jgi:hypothetical protein